MKKILRLTALLVILSLTATSFGGCALLSRIDKTYSKNGFTITMSAAFIPMNNREDLAACYVSDEIAVTAEKVDKSLFDSDISVLEFARRVIEGNGHDASAVSADGYAEYSYEKEVDGDTYAYYARCYKTEKNYWLIHFGCPSDDYEDNLPTFKRWADTIKLD